MSINFPSRSRLEQFPELASGGEAVIREYDPKTVMKVFHAKVDIAKKERKVKFFMPMKSKLPQNAICPIEDVTVNGSFEAYLMRKLVDAEDLHMLTKPKYLATAGLSNKDVLEIITKLGLDLGKLHALGIIIGDISDYNFLMNGKCVYIIEADSWGVEGKFTPDAYTELFTCPDSYAPDGTIRFSKENEYYNFAVLAFNMLTKIHPFGGTYLPERSLSIPERMKRKISVLGAYKKDIKIPKIIGSWEWMSPQLKKDFVDIFEHGKKIDITPDLVELFNNMKYCSTHNIYYYSKYSECPLCNEKAQVKQAPVITTTTQTGKGPQITIVFVGRDCTYVLSDVHYINKNNEAVHFDTGRKFTIPRGKRVEFSKDGKIVYVVDESSIVVYDENNKVISTVERMHKSHYVVKDRELYYVDKGNNLYKLVITPNGNLPYYLNQVYNSIFEVSEDGNVFVASMYPKTAIITTPDYTFEVNYSGRIKEYAIKYDKATHKWLFVYQLSNGKYRTMVFNKNKVEYDDTVIAYNAHTLGNIDFHNNTIYDPDDNRIVGINLVKNMAKEFKCAVVDENSRLQFTGRGFRIFNKDNIYNFG